MSDIDSKRMVYLFVFCTTLFACYSVDHWYLSFVDDVNFENYPWGAECMSRSLVNKCKEKLNEIRTSISKNGEKWKSKCMYMARCV